MVFAEYYKGYGNLIIVQHGREFYTLYGHCERFFKKVGDPVMSGEEIAVAGDTGSTNTKALYFEIRPRTKPADPFLWLRKRR